jgi:hypothetical protein
VTTEEEFQQVKIMEFSELKDKKRVRDGVVCISDRCISEGTGETFETSGEFCSECECGFNSDQVTKENLEEINFIRIKFSQLKIED